MRDHRPGCGAAGGLTPERCTSFRTEWLGRATWVAHSPPGTAAPTCVLSEKEASFTRPVWLPGCFRSGRRCGRPGTRLSQEPPGSISSLGVWPPVGFATSGGLIEVPKALSPQPPGSQPPAPPPPSANAELPPPPTTNLPVLWALPLGEAALGVHPVLLLRPLLRPHIF